MGSDQKFVHAAALSLSLSFHREVGSWVGGGPCQRGSWVRGEGSNLERGFTKSIPHVLIQCFENLRHARCHARGWAYKVNRTGHAAARGVRSLQSHGTGCGRKANAQDGFEVSELGAQ